MGGLKKLIEKDFVRFYHEDDQILHQDNGEIRLTEYNKMADNFYEQIAEAFSHISDTQYGFNFENDIMEVSIKADFMIIKTDKYNELIEKIEQYEQSIEKGKEEPEKKERLERKETS